MLLGSVLKGISLSFLGKLGILGIVAIVVVVLIILAVAAFFLYKKMQTPKE